MHKSKNYDMATQVAMDKLMPKPIQITISMQGGGGLTGLGERPLSSVYGRPIPRTIYRDNGGGISGINKPININGQSHSLAWINPGEASALKAMGGSGKPGPMGIPSYEDEDAVGGNITQTEADLGKATGNWGYSGGLSNSVDDYRDWDYVGRSEIDPRGKDPETDKAFYADPKTGELGGDPRTTTRGKNFLEKTYSFLTGESSDEQVTEKQSDLMDTAKKVAYTHWRNTAGKYSLDAPKDYDTWFNAQDPNELIAGLSNWRGPAGMAMQSSINRVNKQLKKRFKDARDDKAVTLDDDEEFEMSREELSAIVQSAEIDGLEDFTPYSKIGKDYPIWAPGGILAAGVNLISSHIIGTGTVGGVSVHLHKDGSVTPISPEDSPGYDHESMKGENVEPIKRRSRGPQPVAQPSTLEPEPKLTGMAGLLAKRKPTSKSGFTNLENILASTHPGTDFNIG